MQPLEPQILPRPAYVDTRAPVVRRAAQRPWLNLALFAATFTTCAIASATAQGVDMYADPLGIRAGFPYAITLMTILLCHEFGHYVLARVHRVDASLPFFLPAPPLFWFGTFGAFIRMRTMPPHRRALFDIGAAGPWAGVLVAIPALILGLRLSTVQPLQPSEGGLILGDSLLFSWITQLVLGVQSDEATILLHPIALAGWFGLLVTCLNLLPVGQLDGGHISYALFGRHHRWVARGMLTFVVVLGFGGWLGWFVWAVLFLIIGLDHPPTWDPVRLDRGRQIGAALSFLLLILTFMPQPVTFEPPSLPPTFEGERVPITLPEQDLPPRAIPL